MRIKSSTVLLILHPMLTGLLPSLDLVYRGWEDELIITSGSEHTARHGYTSLHYATPGQAIDVRIWSLVTHNRGTVPSPEEQFRVLKEAAAEYAIAQGIPTNWIDVVLEDTHIHIEYQPKRPAKFN